MPGGAHDLTADPTYNPFAESLNGDFYVGHSRQPSVSSLPSLPASDQGSSRSNNSEGAEHKRAPAVVSTLMTSTSHPLLTVDLSLGNITRPSLSRAVSDHESPNDNTHNSLTEEEAREDEKLVLVHEVQPKDSLAAVSIKYGIPMNDLRRANSMWTNDSIHLRRSLYIPIEKASRIPKSPASPFPSAETSSPGAGAENALSSDLTGHATLRRIPAARLSYFPPQPSSISARPSLDSTLRPPLAMSTRHSLDSTPPNAMRKHIRAATTPSFAASSPPTIGSLLNALPVRLSLDSTTSGSTTDSEEHVELTDVIHSRRRKSSSTLKPGEATRSSDVVKTDDTTSATARTSPGRRIRTLQMEPEPGMVVPPVSRQRSEAKDFEMGGRSTVNVRSTKSRVGTTAGTATINGSGKLRQSLWDVFAIDEPDVSRSRDDSETDLEDVL
ncbi:hypothetical protein BD626DRAFT_391804 [Schizophyllum amplum]|uniref:LysM domain-containing protein n=1 Tax=Schizophyllum amplum TaxID=97359 RepID=A0A550CZI5_9AGAR|nr:hypothetical protein BD626DRAFT_391804 [Auriculariopsis ampla]